VYIYVRAQWQSDLDVMKEMERLTKANTKMFYEFKRMTLNGSLIRVCGKHRATVLVRVGDWLPLPPLRPAFVTVRSHRVVSLALIEHIFIHSLSLAFSLSLVPESGGKKCCFSNLLLITINTNTVAAVERESVSFLSARRKRKG
jgi:hypothetical protein